MPIPHGASVTPLALKLARLEVPDAPDDWYRRARRVLRGGDGGEHGLLLYKLAREFAQPGVPMLALDIGTARGFSAMSVARAILDSPAEGRVHTIDTFPHDESRIWHVAKQQDDELEGAPPMSRSEIWRRWFAEESAAVSPITGRSLPVLEAWPHGLIDLAFLDGSHAYADVKGELALLDSLMAERSAIVMDDYHLGVGVAHAVHGQHHLRGTRLLRQPGSDQRLLGARGVQRVARRLPLRQQLDPAGERRPIAGLDHGLREQALHRLVDLRDSLLQ